MSKHQHPHDKDRRADHDRHGHTKKKQIHHDWRFWVSIVALVLMLLSMAMYVMSFDESLRWGGNADPEVPASSE